MENVVKDTVHQVANLSLHRLGARGSSHNLLVLGNAYGVLPYQKPLAVAMAERGFVAWYFAFSGQDGTTGAFSGNDGVRDISHAVEFILSQNSRRHLFVLAHCTSSLMTLEYLRQVSSIPIKAVAFYGLLFNPRRRWEYASKRLKAYNVNIAVTDGDLDYNPVAAVRDIETPMLFCHATDKTNLDRATPEEMQLVVKSAPNAKLVLFDNGYDKDLSYLDDFVPVYDSWFKSQVVIETNEFEKVS